MIADAIASHDPDKARKAMILHLQINKDILENKIKG
jgi:DNA-binding FadR family transcriptional regulator